MNLKEKYPWIDLIQPEDLPTYDLKTMAEIIGMPLTIKLLTEAVGSTFVMSTTWDREVMKRYIKRVYDGTKPTRMHLCKLCNVTENYIYKVCSAKKRV